MCVCVGKALWCGSYREVRGPLITVYFLSCDWTQMLWLGPSKHLSLWNCHMSSLAHNSVTGQASSEAPLSSILSEAMLGLARFWSPRWEARQKIIWLYSRNSRSRCGSKIKLLLNLLLKLTCILAFIKLLACIRTSPWSCWARYQNVGFGFKTPYSKHLVHLGPVHFNQVKYIESRFSTGYRLCLNGLL